jgi:hypothetical protein
VKRVVLLAVGAVALACAPSRHDATIPAGSGPLVAVYKATIDDGQGAVRHARMSLWAERPDRLHVEILGPLGGETFALDAGAGALCVVDVARATAFAGPDDPEAIEALVGVRLTAGAAVAALLSGASPDGLTVTRADAIEGTLPETLTIVDGNRSVTLTLVRFVRGIADASAIGTGTPPAGLTVRPLSYLRREGGP